MKIKGSIYLAGAITGLSYEDARYGWRSVFARAIDDALEAGGQSRGEVGILSPMRGKDHIAGYSDNDNPITGHIASEYVEHAMSTGKGIVARDRWDTKRCDVVVANLLDTAPGAVSIGTCIEFGWRDGNGPLVMIAPDRVGGPAGKTHPHDHLMLYEIADYIVHTVEEAAELTLKLLRSGV